MSKLPTAVIKGGPVKESFTAQQRFYLWMCGIIVGGIVTGVLGSIQLIMQK